MDMEEEVEELDYEDDEADNKDSDAVAEPSDKPIIWSRLGDVQDGHVSTDTETIGIMQVGLVICSPERAGRDHLTEND